MNQPTHLADESILDTLQRRCGRAPWWFVSAALHLTALLLLTLSLLLYQHAQPPRLNVGLPSDTNAIAPWSSITDSPEYLHDADTDAALDDLSANLDALENTCVVTVSRCGMVPDSEHPEDPDAIHLHCETTTYTVVNGQRVPDDPCRLPPPAQPPTAQPPHCSLPADPSIYNCADGCDCCQADCKTGPCKSAGCQTIRCCDDMN